MIRTFVAVEMSSDIREKLSCLQGQLKKTLPPMNWVRSESMHLTLKFLGWVDPSQVFQLLSVLDPIGMQRRPFSIAVQGLGVFPHIKYPRIFWVGIVGNTNALQELVFDIEAALEPLGFPPEEKPYHPHLTLGRIKRENSNFGSVLRKSGLLDDEHNIGGITITRLVLFRSDLDASGATYTPLGTVQLSDNEPEG